MPIYEYRCTVCGADTEVLQRIHDKPLKTCTHCGGGLEKLISRSSFQLKGAGWYVTDYARKGGAGGSSEPTSSKEEGGSKSSDSPSGKPAKKTESGD